MSKKSDLWLSPADIYMNFDSSNLLLPRQGFFLPNLLAIGHGLSIWSPVDPNWHLHNLWPHQCAALWSMVLPTKFGYYRAFLSNLIHDWPCWPLHDLLPQQCILLQSGVLPTNLVAIGHFRSNLTSGWPLTIGGVALNVCSWSSWAHHLPPCQVSAPNKKDITGHPHTQSLVVEE